MDKNLHEVSQMLKGEHKTQKKKLFGFTGSAHVTRKVGDVWFTENEFGNKTWHTKHEGYTSSSNLSPDAQITMQKLRDELEKYPNCLKEKCDAKNTRLDKKFRFKTGMCSECTCKHEDNLRISGQFKEYEKSKMLDKAQSIFRDSNHVLEEIVAPLKRGYIEEVQPNGVIKKTEVDPAIAEQIVDEYNAYKTDVINTITTL